MNGKTKWDNLRGRKVKGFELQVGSYSNGRGALLVLDDEGVPECKISVNLPETEIEDDEFWVKRGVPEEWAYRLAELKLAEYAYMRTGAGMVADYATLWRLLP